MKAPHNDIELDDNSIRNQIGCVPTSVWHLKKTQSLLLYVDDEIAKNTYSGESDISFGRLSQFNPDVAKRIIRLWSKKGDTILDPFAGRCRAYIAQNMDRHYVGYEISPRVCKQLTIGIEKERLANYKYKPRIINADSRTLASSNQYDFIFTCPPYWDVEDYNLCYAENTQGQLSNLHSYNDFLIDYGDIIKKCFSAVKPGKFCAWVVADIRRDKKLIPFHADTIKIFQRHGFILNDIVILQNNSPSVTGIASCIKYGYCPKSHEYLLIFRKPGEL